MDLAYTIVEVSFCKAVCASVTVRKGRSQVGSCPQLELKFHNNELKCLSLLLTLVLRISCEGPLSQSLGHRPGSEEPGEGRANQAQVLLYANKVNQQMSSNMCELCNGTASFPHSESHRLLSCDSEVYNKGDSENCD